MINTVVFTISRINIGYKIATTNNDFKQFNTVYSCTCDLFMAMTDLSSKINNDFNYGVVFEVE